MNILILHRIPYAKIDYHRGIDHENHQVTYLGTNHQLESIPINLRCIRTAFTEEDISAEKIIAWARQKRDQFDRVIALSEFQLRLAAEIREGLNIEGPGVDRVNCVRNKLIMKDHVRSAGILTSHYTILSDYLLSKDEDPSAGLIIKPIDGACSRAVHYFKTRSDLVRYVKVAGFPEQLYLVEAFVPGTIWHIDGLVFKGRLVIAELSRYVGTCLGFARGQPLGSVQHAMSPYLWQWAQRCITAVNIEEGSFHLEMIQTKLGWYFLEIANRVGGADVVRTFEWRTGVHLPSTELRMFLGEAPSALRMASCLNDYQGWFVFPGHIQRSAKGNDLIRFAEDEQAYFRDHPCVREWNDLGDRFTRSDSISYHAHESPLSGCVQGVSPKALVVFLSRLFASAEIR